MIFEEEHEGATNWGCPRFSEAAGQWLIHWYDSRGNLTGANLAKPDALEWIKANPKAVSEMQNEVQRWLTAKR